MSQKIGHAHPISIDNFRLISEPAHETPLLDQFLSLLYTVPTNPDGHRHRGVRPPDFRSSVIGHRGVCR